MNVHCYILILRQNIGAGNWAVLKALFDAMGTHGSKFPNFNLHPIGGRIRLDGDAVLYESKFDTSEVSIDAFKQMLADEFEVDVVDIDSVESSADYAGIGTTVWQFNYSAVERFRVERFGDGGATWMDSGDEARGYLKLNAAEWEPEEL